MKKRGLLILFLILLCNITLAEPEIKIQHIEIDDYIKTGQDLTTQITIKNTGGKSLSNLKLSTYLIGADLRASKYSDKIIIGESETTTLRISTRDIKPGLYYLRIIAEDSNIRRIRYRDIIIT